MNEKIELAASALRQIIHLIDDDLPPHIVRGAAVRALAKLAENGHPMSDISSATVERESL